MTVERRENVLLVPYDCLQQEADGTAFVYCLQGDTAIRRAVTLGKDYPEGTEVLEGLQDGERLVRAPERLAGEAVRVYAEETV